MLPTLQLLVALIVTTVPAICVKRYVGHRGPSWRRLFVCSGVSAGAAHEDPQLGAPGAGWWFVPPEFLPVQKPEASLLPRAFLPPPFLKLDIMRCSYAKLLPRSVRVV